MGPTLFRQHARASQPRLPKGVCLPVLLAGVLVLLSIAASAQTTQPATRARRFLSGRTLSGNLSAAHAMSVAREQHAAMLVSQRDLPPSTGLSATWQPLGPNQVVSVTYGNVTGRVTSIAIDSADSSGNTVYLGTTGGGVWKSTNAAGPSSNITFTPLTDTLPVFSANAGSSAIPSLSIGAVSVGSGVILAGTGDPNDASDSFYGDGILRSADGGLTWALIQNSHDGVAGNHSFTGLSFAGFAWSTSSPGTVVAAVSQAAEGALVNAVDTTNSVMGLYYSTDAGVTWQMSVLMDGSQTLQTPLPGGSDDGGHAATSVVWNPIRQRFYAAIRFHGYYESPDGVTWTRLANQPGSALTLAACPTIVLGTSGSPSCPIFRGALAIQPVTGDTFALTTDIHNLDWGLWQDVCALSGTACAGNTVTFSRQLNSSPLETGNGDTTIPQADYNLALSAAPTGTGPGQDTLLYAGTVDLYRCSLAAGCVFRNTTNAINACHGTSQVAPAQHAIAVLAVSAQPLLYLGNDGGLWRSTDGVAETGQSCSSSDATHFQNLNSGLGSLAEVISFAQHPTDPNTLLAGLGANGTSASSAALSLTPWPQLSAGEGGTTAIDSTNPQLWYISTGEGISITQCAQGAACTAQDFAGTATIGYAQIESDDSAIDPPWLLDPALTSNLIAGTCRVWRGPAANGALWSSANDISPLLAGPQNASCSSTNPVVRSLAAGGPTSDTGATQNAGSQVIYAGMAGTLDGGGSFGGHLFSTITANTATATSAWADLATNPVTNISAGSTTFNPGGFDLSSVTVDSHDATGKTVYATVMGFSENGISASHVYRSTDGGSHWTVIDSNLPNAPANSLAVDPNDANTIYVALDTGVYVTSNVTICPTVNCWSVYGTSLPNAPVVVLSAAPNQPTGDGRTGELRAATYGRGIWQIPLLTASAGQQAAIGLNPAALTFATQAVDTASSSQTITVTNTGVAALDVSKIAVAGDFDETDTCTATDTSIAPGQTCAIQVRFLPSATGARSGTLTVYGNIPGGQATASLSGNASPAPTVVLTPLTLTFAQTAINSTSAVQNITISNTGSATVALHTPSITGDFRITANTCAATLTSQVGCTVAIAFAPTASGTRSGTFTITDDAGTQTAFLAGTGVSPATDALSPLSLTFASQQITTSSPPQLVTLTNSGDLPLTLIATQITIGDFTVVNACGNSLNPHSACTLQVAFQPKNIGQLTGILAVSDQYRTQNITLSGTGIAPPGVSLAPFSTVSFAPLGIGLTSSPQTVTLTNNGTGPLSIQGIALTGDFAIATGSNNCGAVLALGAACTMQVVFTPTTTGPRSGTLTVTDDAPNAPQILQLTGTGVDFTLTPDGATTVTTTSGQNAVFPLLLSSASNVPGSVTFVCTGIPANSTCNITPSTVALGYTTTVSLTVLTGVSTTSSSLPAKRTTLWLAALLPFGLLALRRRRLACGALLCVLIAASGCGAGRQIPLTGGSGSSPSNPSGPATPSGTYTVVANASSAGLTRTINLTLIVQ